MNSIILLILAMLLAPLYAGLIIKVKAFFGGRKGSPLLIHYYTLAKLLKKGSVYSTSTTALFKLGPWFRCAPRPRRSCFCPLPASRRSFRLPGM